MKILIDTGITDGTERIVFTIAAEKVPEEMAMATEGHFHGAIALRESLYPSAK